MAFNKFSFSNTKINTSSAPLHCLPMIKILIQKPTEAKSRNQRLINILNLKFYHRQRYYRQNREA